MSCRILYVPGTKSVDKVFAENGNESELFNTLAESFSGDKDAAYKEYIKTRTSKFKEWIGSSTFVDKNGEPMVFFHGGGAVYSKFMSDMGRGPEVTEQIIEEAKDKYRKDVIRLKQRHQTALALKSDNTVYSVREISTSTAFLEGRLEKALKRAKAELGDVLYAASEGVNDWNPIFFTRDPSVTPAYGSKRNIVYLRGENTEVIDLAEEKEWNPDIEQNSLEDAELAGKDSVVFKNIHDLAPELHNEYVLELSEEESKERAEKGLLRKGPKGDTRHDQYLVFDSFQVKSSVKNSGEYNVEDANVFNQLENTGEHQLPDEIEADIKGFLDQIGVQVNTVDHLRDRDGNFIDGVAKADMIKKTIDVVEGRADSTTLPEEAAHFYVNLLKAAESPLYDSMRRMAPNYHGYDTVMEEYSSNPMYQNADGTPNKEKLVDEAMGKIIAAHMLAYTGANPVESPGNLSRIGRWWQKALKFLKRIFNIASNPYAVAYWDMVSGKIQERYGDVDISKVDGGEFLQQSNVKSKQDTIVDKVIEDMQGLTTEEVLVENIPSLDKRLIPEGETTIERYVHTSSTGEETIFPNRVTDKTQLKFIKSVGAERAHKISTSNALLAEGGVALHGVAQNLAELHGSKLPGLEIVPTHSNGIPKNLTEAAKHIEVDPRLKNGKSDPKSKLSSGVLKVMKQINDLQKQIDPNGKAKVLTEAMLRKGDTVGTVDLFVVFSNGSVAIYDWKFNSPGAFYTKGFGTGKKLIVNPLDIKLDSYNMQISSYKDMAKGYGVDEFVQTRIIPAHVQYYNKPTKVGDTTTYEKTKVIQVLDIGSDQNEFMSQLAVAGELTKLADLNKLVKGLLLSRDINTARLEGAKGEAKVGIYDTIKSIDAQIQSIVVERNVGEVLETVSGHIKAVEDRLHINDPKDKKHLTTRELEMFLEDFSIYKELGQYLQTHLAHATKKNAKKAATLAKGVAAASLLVNNTLSAVHNKLHERMVELGEAMEAPIGDITGTDPVTKQVTIKTESPKELSWAGRNIQPMSESDNPVLRVAHRNIAQSLSKTEERQKVLDAKILNMKDKMKVYSKKSGLKTDAIMDKLLNPKTGNLINEVSSDFYEEIKERQSRGEENDIKWIKEHLQIKTGARKNYIKFLQDAEERARRRFPDLTETTKDGEVKIIKSRAKDRTSYLENFKSKYDVWSKSNNSAWKSPKWRAMLELKDSTISEYKSEEWKALESIENKKLLEIVHEYRELVEELSDEFGEYIPNNFVANIRDTSTERFINSGVLAGFAGVAEDLRRSVMIVEDDQSMGVVGMDGTLKASIPVNHLMPLRDSKGMTDVTLKSRDIFKSLSALGGSIYNHKHMTEIEANMLGLQDYLQHQMSESSTDNKGMLIRKNGDVLTKETSAETLKYFDSMVKFYVYGQSVQSKDVILGGVSMNKAVASLMSSYSMKTLALPFTPALAARIAGEALLRVNATQGLHYDSKGINDAEKAMFASTRKFSAFGKFFNIYQQGESWKRHRDLSMKNANKYLNLPALYAPLRHTDENLEDIIVWAMAHKHGVDEEGNLQRLEDMPEGSKSLHDLTSFDNSSGEFFITGLTESAYLDFRARVKASARKVKGQMDGEDILGYSTSLLGKAVGQFKGWGPGLVLSHVSGKKYNHVLKAIEEGRFNGTTQELMNAWNSEVAVTENMLGMLSGAKDVLLQFAFLKKMQGDPQKRAQLKKENKWSEADENKYQSKRKALAQEMEIWKNNSTDPKILALDNVDEFMRMRTRSVQQTYSQMRWTIGSFMAVMMLGGLGPDDDKWASRYKSSRILMKILAKARLELGFMMNPVDMVKMVASPLPVIQVFSDLIKATNNFFNESYQLITGDHNKKDDTPFMYYTLPYALPGWQKARQFIEPHAQDKRNPYQ